MKPSDYEEFKRGITGVMSFYRKEVSNFALDIWWNALKNYDLKAINDAFGRHLMNPDTGQFEPKPADIIRMMQGSTLDSALLAWAKVDRAIRHVGTHQSVVFDDPLIHAVIYEMGGWVALGQKREDEWPFVAKEFEARYRGYKARGEKPAYTGILLGIADSQNQREGFAAQPPILIGNESQANQVLMLGSDSATIGFKQAGKEVMGQFAQLKKPTRKEIQA
jgi:hypothetical protein